MEKKPDSSRRSDRSRRAILSAATELVAEKGYAKLTIEAIAARAGVGKQTIYRWWPSKGVVVLDALHAMNSEAVGTSPDDLALPDTGDVEADLKLLLRSTADELADPRYAAAYRALTAEIQHDPVLSKHYHEQILRPGLEATKERLRIAQRAGQVAEDIDLQVAVELIYGPFIHRWLFQSAPITHEYTDSLAEYALKALHPG